MLTFPVDLRLQDVHIVALLGHLFGGTFGTVTFRKRTHLNEPWSGCALGSRFSLLSLVRDARGVSFFDCAFTLAGFT
jgi:hypothetical protein